MRFFLLFICFSLFVLAPIAAQWQRLPGPQGGEVTCSALSDNGVLYAGGAGGVFKSTDGGHTWSRLPGDLPLQAVPRELEWDGGNLYVRAAAYATNQNFLFKSRDDGATWQQILGNVGGDDNWSIGGMFAVRNDTILVRSSPVSLRSTDGGATWPQTVPTFLGFVATAKGYYGGGLGGVYYSPDAAAFSWQSIYTAANADQYPARVEYIGNRIFIFFVRGPVFLVSDNNGIDWKAHELPVAYQYNALQWVGDEDVLYALLPGGAFRSVDGGESWTLVSTEAWQGQKAYLLNGTFVATGPIGIAVAENPAQSFLMAEGFSSPDVWSVTHPSEGVWVAGTQLGLFRSPNNGATWTEVALGAAGAHAEVVRRLQSEGTKVAAFADTLMYYSEDAGATWAKRAYPVPLPPYYQGLNVTDAEFKQGVIYLCTSAGAWRSADGGQSWQLITANGWTNAMLTRAVSVRDSAILIGAQWSDVALSLDAGQHWQNLSTGLGGLPYILFNLDWNGEYMLAVSGYRMMRRMPALTGAWQQVALPLPVDASDGPIPYLLHFNGDTVFAAIAGRGVFRSTDKSDSWALWNDMPLYERLRNCYWNDSLTVLSMNGGIWYAGQLTTMALEGKLYNDINDDGQAQPNEPPLAGHVVHLTASQNYATTDATGRYRFDQFLPADTLRVFPQTPGVRVSPPFRSVKAPAGNLDFGLFSPLGNLNLAVTLTNLQTVRPGFATDFVITCRNDGYAPAGGVLCFVKDPNLQYLSASLQPAQFKGDTLCWDIEPLAPGGATNVTVRVRAPATVGLGTLVYLEAAIKAAGFDVLPLNNRDYTTITVVGSYDPNDKTVLPKGPITPAMVANTQLLTYTVRFQNTGTFPAENVRITDTLSPLLDLASLRVVSASHPFSFSLRPGRVLEIRFDQINLLDSMANEAASHGFVRYQVNARRDLVLGQTISNHADIFFDFNAPIRTNTVLTHISLTNAAVSVSERPLTLNVAPNPANDQFSVFFDNPSHTEAEVRVFSAMGRLMWEGMATTHKEAHILSRGWPAGFYRVRVQLGRRHGEAAVVKR